MNYVRVGSRVQTQLEHTLTDMSGGLAPKSLAGAPRMLAYAGRATGLRDATTTPTAGRARARTSATTPTPKSQGRDEVV